MVAVVFIFDFLYSFVSPLLVKFEGHYSKTQESISLTRKLTWSTAVNSTLLLVATHLITCYTRNIDYSTLWINGGLLNDTVSLLIGFAFISPALLILDIVWITRKISQCMIVRSVKTSPITQGELNEALQGVEIDYADNYS